MKVLSWLNFLLGLWLIVAAFALPVRTGSAMAAESVAGIVVVVLAYSLGGRTAETWDQLECGHRRPLDRGRQLGHGHPVEAECDARRSSRPRTGDGECPLLPLAGTD